MSSFEAVRDAIVHLAGASSPQALVLWDCREPRLPEELASRLSSAVRLVTVSPDEINAAGIFHELASEDSIKKVAVAGWAESNAGTELDDGLLLAAAQAGFFAAGAQSGGAGSVEAQPTVAHLCFERRDYRIRLAGEPDLGVLENLERVCWPTRLQTSRERILARLRTHPEGQLVLLADRRVVAAVYSQRTDIDADLTGVTMWTVETLHRPRGAQVYLLGIAVQPEMQDRNFGSELLEFILQRSARQRGVERVAGVTRCKDMARHPQLVPERYIRLRNELGGLVDTTLRFHEQHGAEIAGLVPGYRPDDDENHRYGVLVRYDLANRRVKTSVPGPVTPSLASPSDGSLTQLVWKLARELLQKHGDQARPFSLSTPLMEMGLDSGDILELREQINHHCGLSIETEFFFNHNTLQKVIAALQPRVAEAAAREPAPKATGIRGDDIAIIGLAVRLPGGIDNVEGFWDVLFREECVVGRVPDARLTWPDGIDPGGTHSGIDQGGFLADITGFDAELFNISRREAELMDPQQRLLVELGWECLEEAGHFPQTVRGSRTGVFVGASGSDYARVLADTGMEPEAHSGLGTSMAIMANRISYLFDLCGPSLLIDTACSSSLVAVHSAVKALRAGECDRALAGGVNVICHASASVAFYKAGMLSPDGLCRSFDEAANGYVRAEGGAMILLKPLADALAEGDAIHAVIKGSAVNHGGRANGLTVPHPGKQAALVTEAWRDAGVETGRAGYIEAHGSATPLGDPIEIAGLKQAFMDPSGTGPLPGHGCAVGSVKSNLGHLEAAAGIVGLIKVALALEHRFIPASLHCTRVNPHISLEGSRLHVATTAAVWPAPAGEGSRCGGVSSFGSGGANAHVVLEEAPAHIPARRDLPRHVFSRQRYWAPDRYTAQRTGLRSDDTPEGFLAQLPAAGMVPSAPPVQSLIQALRTTLAQCLSLTTDRLPIDALFLNLGLDSIMAAEWTAELNRRYGIAVSLQALQRYPSIHRLAEWLTGQGLRPAEAPAPAHSLPSPNEAPSPAGSPATACVARPLSSTDLETWSGLEKAELGRLHERIKKNPDENVLLERNGQNVSYVSLRRIKSVDSLHQATFEELSSMPSDGAGEVLLLSELGLSPDHSIAGLNQETLAWVLRHAESIPGITSVVHIARCTGFSGRSEAEFAKYLLEAHRGDFSGEPLLHDHHQLGGAVRGLLANYRPADRVNLGMGVWVQHDLPGIKAESPSLASGNAYKAAPSNAQSLGRLMKEQPQIVPLAMQGAGPTTFWIHPMSGEVGVYHKLAGQIQSSFKMIGLQARGFLRPEHKPLDAMPEIARQYADIVTTAQAAGPYHLAGFSFGGTIAYEVARELQGRGAQVASLLMIEAPFVSDEVAELTTMSRRSALVMNANFLVLALLTLDSAVAAKLRSGAVDWTRYRVTEDAVSHLPDHDLPDFLAAHCGRCGVTQSVETIKQKLVTMTDVHLANARAIQTYRTTVLERPREIRCALLRTRDAIATSNLSVNPPYLDAIQRRHHSMAKVLEGWNAILPHAEHVVLEGANHFELFHDEQSVTAVCRAVCEFYQAPSETRPLQWNGTQLPAASSEPTAPGTLSRAEAGRDLRSGIAVIGMSGRFPDANDIEAFWRNLASGRSSVKAVPGDRGWNIDDYYDPKPQRPAKTYCRRGAFLDDIAGFDPLFFGISPLEAELMDPAERLFLQEAWRAIEHAGYAPGRLKRRKWGVFACVKGDYPTLVQKFHPTFLAATDSSSPARLSYALDLCGPAISIDTACSSALAAVAHGCDSLSAGSCDAAVVGASGVYVTPNMLVTSSQSLLFSPEGECYTFDERANGTVLGEAVGVVVLKRLADALADGDPILGVIRGWGSNQNGRTNGLTAPSTSSQTALQTDVYRRYGIDADKITLVEAHGTGTKLGDPVEYQALRESFASYTQREHYCALGSLKTNIGHPFAAAGIAGLIKVLLALQHRQIPPSLNFRTLNPLIDENGSPFFVNTVLREWEAPDDQPRLAAINSFGATGINVHLVVEEHRAEPVRSLSLTPEMPVVILLSAKDRPRLEDGCRVLLQWIRRRSAGSPRLAPNLRDLAYTLQVARESMEARLAFVAHSLDDLQLRLAEAIERPAAQNASYYAELKPGRAAANVASLSQFDVPAGPATEAALDRLAHAWAHGGSVDWDVLYGEAKPRRIHLPGYVFARDRYWVGSRIQPAERALNTPAAPECLHPVLHRNTSTPGKLRFSSFFSGNEFFLADHVVHGERILPGVAYLEMAREAAARAMPGWIAGDPESILCLRNVVWLRPFAVGAGGREIHLELETRADNDLAFEVYSVDIGNSAARVVHSQGRLELRSGAAAMKAAKLQLLEARCDRATLTADSCYAVFRENRVDYGPGHRGVVRIHAGGARPAEAEVLARLELPPAVREGSERFVLHPSLLDSALQSALGLAYVAIPGDGSRQLSMPFSLDQLELYGPCVPEMWAHLRRVQTADAGKSVEKLDIDLYDGVGRGLIRLRGLASKVTGNSVSAPGQNTGPATRMFVPVWRPAPSPAAGLPPPSRWVIAVNPAGQQPLPGRDVEDDVEVCRIELRDSTASEQYTQLAVELFALIRTRLRANTGPHVLLQVALSGVHRNVLSAVSALVRTAEQESSRISGQVVEFSGGGWPPDVFERLIRWSTSAEQKHVRDEGGDCRTLDWEQLQSSDAVPVWRDGGVYLITGGAGGLGWIFASEIARTARRPVLILVGRSSSEGLDAKLEELRSLGAIVSYEQVDVSQPAEVNRLIEQSTARHGVLHGILHAAGVVRDRLMVNKTSEEFAAVLASKVGGATCLDEATRRMPLELFVLFSSGAGVLGNAGQADYAAANAFMDRFAEVRQAQVIAGRGYGRTLSINWPLWQDGGMKVSPETVVAMARSLGIVPLPLAEGMRAFYDACTSTASQVMVIHGDPARIVSPVVMSHGGRPAEDAATSLAADPATTGAGVWRDKAVTYFQSLIATLLKIPRHRVDPTATFEKYGIDSIIASALVNQMEETYGLLPKTLFFEYQTVEALADYFVSQHRDRTAELVGVDPRPPVPGPHAATSAEPPRMPPVPAQPITVPAVPRPLPPTDVAIIGLAGRFPGAGTVGELWANLRAGKDCVTEVPSDRWDLTSCFHPDKSQHGKSYSKWGGFIEGVDLFDPLFFNLAPQIAALIDPKERLFLETVWELFESVGLTRDAIQRRHGGSVGVFVGAMYQDYHAFDSTWINEAIVSLSSYSSIANRVSHFFSFGGPSVAIDTMCSSTLSAIKMACDSLLRGECEMAVAGAANLSLHPKKYVGLSLGRIIGSQPGSRAFSDGDGYIPADTVGAFLLKPLADAVRDGDRVMAVIKSVLLNHDGGANGYAIPNPAAQAKLIQENFRRSGVHPRTVSYVEAAANGSALGDPIEVAALKTAFRAFTAESHFCAIGTIKSNIGHAEAASGVGQLAKVLLQLQHGELVPSIKTEPLNPGLSFVDSPFYLQREVAAWRHQPAEDHGSELPRRACVSSFGAGGSNAHLIVEEYVPADAGAPSVAVHAAPQVLVFSARTAERLRVHVERMLPALEGSAGVSLRDLAYTLQCGREAMDCRLAFVALSLDAVQSTLHGWLEGGAAPAGTRSQGYYTGDRHADSQWNGLAGGRSGAAWIEGLLAEQDLEKLALLWANGASVPWHILYADHRPRILALPTYPFERRRCRLEPASSGLTAGRQDATSPVAVDPVASDWRTQLAGMLGMAPDELNLDTPLEEYGLESVLHTQFAQLVRTQVDANLSLNDLRSCRTLRELLAVLPETPVRRAVPPHSPEVTFRELVQIGRGIEPPVFWFHAGVGGVEAYEAIAAHSERTFYGIQARGWMSDDPPLQGMAALADYYALIVQATQPSGPYDLGGYSMGGALAYEVTRRLQQAGQSVRSIVMLDTLDGSGVGRASPSPLALYLQVVNTLLASSATLAGNGLTQRLIHRDEIAGETSESAFLDRLIALARERGLAKTAPQLRSVILQIASVQRAYEYENFNITPLPRPNEVEAYYVRNTNGVFLGSLEPYFNLDSLVLDRSDHWREWHAQLPGFRRVDVSSTSHMTLLMEKDPLNAILELCGALYGRKNGHAGTAADSSSPGVERQT